MSSDSKILIHDDISIATTMPSRFYLEKKYFQRTIDRVFNNSWQLTINKNSLKENIKLTIMNNTTS